MTATPPSVDERAVLAKVAWRLMPFLFVLYLVAYLDRVNVGFANLHMSRDLGFDERVFGFGAGVFFLGYAAFEIPSNLILERVGARLWMARIMVTWGVISAATMLVRTSVAFGWLRFLLGLAEAGFFPGMILYLTYWFPTAERARAVAWFMTATALSGVIGGPLSGELLGLEGRCGLHGWQWLFLLEGLPSVLLGFATLAWLPDGPHQARWLEPAERDWLLARLATERQEREHRHGYTLGRALLSGRVWWLCLIYFSLTIGLYGVTIWLPQLVKQFQITDRQVGLVTAVPYFLAAIAMVLASAHSDRTGERRRHVASAAAVGGLGLALSSLPLHPVLTMAAICLATIGIWSAFGPFWALPAAFLTGDAAAGGIALINALGNLGGFAGPYLCGWLKQATHSFTAGLLLLSLSLLLGSVLALSQPAIPETSDPRPP